MQFCPKCSSKLKKLHDNLSCPECDKEKFNTETVQFFLSPRHANMKSRSWDRHFKEIHEIKRLTFTPNTDVVISIATRFNFEKVAYMNRQSIQESTQGFKDDGVRIPYEQIDNLVFCLKNIENRCEKFKAFSPIFRLEVGPNTDVVVSWKESAIDDKRVFLNYRSQPSKNFDYEAHGVTFPFQLITQIIEELWKIKPMIEN